VIPSQKSLSVSGLLPLPSSDQRLSRLASFSAAEREESGLTPLVVVDLRRRP
jgi:hypothetical protein